MKVLDLFAGLGGWSESARARGHQVVTLDLDPRFGCTITADVLEVEPLEIVERLGGRPDLILASPPCESFSVLTIGRNWTGPKAWPPHQPKTEKARLALRLVERTLELIDALEPAYYVIENPRAKLRKLPVVAGLERRTVTYCQLGEPFQKPTDLWGGFPPSLVLPPPCRAGDPCHVRAPRGSRTGIQGEGVVMLDGEPAPVKPGRPMATGGMVARLGGRAHRPDLAALRAKIPARLAELVLDAAERDLARDLHYEPVDLFSRALP